MQDKGSPDPLAGTGLLRIFFDDGLLAMFGTIRMTPGKVIQMCELAETDPRFKVGRWLRAGFQNVDNVVAGKRMRELLVNLPLDCRIENSQDFFDATPLQLLDLSDRDLGQRVKTMYRGIKNDKPRIELIAKRFLTQCAQAHKLS